MAARAIERLDVLGDDLTVGEIFQADLPQPLVGAKTRPQNFTDESCIVDTIKNADDPITKVIEIVEDIMNGFVESDATQTDWLDVEDIDYLSEDKYLAAEIWAVAQSWLKGVASEQEVERKLKETDGVTLVPKEQAAKKLGANYETAHDLETSAVDIIYDDVDGERYFVQVKSSSSSASKVNVSGNELLNGVLYTDADGIGDYSPRGTTYTPPWE